jgi:hypothetical protein
MTESVPRRCGAHTSVISTLGLSGPEALRTVAGAVDTEVFNVYVGRILRPALRRGDILLLESLRARHASRIEEVAAECGASALGLVTDADCLGCLKRCGCQGAPNRNWL